MWSRIRPGVPTTMWAPAASARRSATGSVPPTTLATRPPAAAKSQESSPRTCKASSRVGAITSTSGPPAGGTRSSSPISSGAMASP